MPETKITILKKILTAYKKDKLHLLPLTPKGLPPELAAFYNQKISEYKLKKPIVSTSLVDVRTGAAAPAGTKPGTTGYITQEAFIKRNTLVDEQTGGPAPEGTDRSTPGYITQDSYIRRNRLVDEKTGDPAPKGTVPGTAGYITHDSFTKRNNLVDEKTGDPASEGTRPGTAGYITQKAFIMRHNLVDEQTGVSAPEGTIRGTAGYITQGAFNQRHKLVDEQTGAPAPKGVNPGTAGYITLSAFNYRNNVVKASSDLTATHQDFCWPAKRTSLQKGSLLSTTELGWLVGKKRAFHPSDKEDERSSKTQKREKSAEIDSIEQTGNNETSLSPANIAASGRGFFGGNSSSSESLLEADLNKPISISPVG